MALRDLKEIQKQADGLKPEEQIRLAHYLLAKAAKAGLKPTGDLTEFKGSLKLTVDPLEFQRAIRAEWP